jgi:hypothetical protein
MTGTAPSFIRSGVDMRAELIQDVAETLPNRLSGILDVQFDPELYGGYLLEPRLNELTSIVAARFIEMHGETVAHEVGSGLDTAIEDCRTVLRGIKAAINLSAPSGSYSAAQQASIARHSYGVLREFSLRQSAVMSRGDYSNNDLVGKGIVREGGATAFRTRLKPTLLELTTGRVPIVRFKSPAKSEESKKNSEVDEDQAVEVKMLCPAFRGKPRKTPRLPKQLWVPVVDIYEACGEFK